MKTHETLTLDLPVFITFPIRLHIHCDLIFYPNLILRFCVQALTFMSSQKISRKMD